MPPPPSNLRWKYGLDRGRSFRRRALRARSNSITLAALLISVASRRLIGQTSSLTLR